jgi:copper chaperone CopZ
MACGGCANSVRQALLRLDGVQSAEVSHADGRAVVAYDALRVSPEALKAAVAQLGYQAA